MTICGTIFGASLSYGLIRLGAFGPNAFGEKGCGTVADCTINYVRLSPEQVEAQKRYGFTAENLRVTAKFNTSFTNHGMQIPQLLILKVSNDIQLEADLVLVLAQ